MKTKLIVEVEVFDPEVLKKRAGLLVRHRELDGLADQLYEVLRSEETPLDCGFQIIDWRVEPTP